ncbi:hypothetical protein BHL53_14445 [Bacillus cereus]|uniref:ETX/MTX2 family pore-forming toxin n=1 Tax=Bacillus cereus TaxID=1396 RepID=UPI000994C130|nr:ETX/MTX2 family pore-forming toxin [Bacillus cereus]OPA24272.1 hypothetical protein BHL53_14445 [Bacillus cereus]
MRKKTATSVTATIMSLGILGLGDMPSAYALENTPIYYTDFGQENNQISEQYKRDTERFLNGWFQYGNTAQTIGKINDSKASDEIIMAQNGTLDNTQGSTPQKFTTISESVKQIDSVTTTKGLEGSFEAGLEASFESEQSIGVAKAKESLKATMKVGMKKSESQANTQTNERMITIPSQNIEVPAGKKYQIRYIVKKAEMSGELSQVKEITRGTSNDGLINSPRVSYAIDVSKPGTNAIDSMYWEDIYNATPYQFFNRLDEIKNKFIKGGPQQEFMDVYLQRHNVGKDRVVFQIDGMDNQAGNNDNGRYRMSEQGLLGNIYLNHNLKKVYVNSENIPFTASIGLDYVIQLVDITNGDDTLLKETQPSTVGQTAPKFK